MFLHTIQSAELKDFFVHGLSKGMEETTFCKLYQFLSFFKKLLKFLWMLTTLSGLLIFSAAYSYSSKYRTITDEYFTEKYQDILFREYFEDSKCVRGNNVDPASLYVGYGAGLALAGILLFIFQSWFLQLTRYEHTQVTVTLRYHHRHQSGSMNNNFYEYSIVRRSLTYYILLGATNTTAFLLLFIMLEAGYCLDPPEVDCSGLKANVTSLKRWTDTRIFQPTEKEFYYLTSEHQRPSETCCGISIGSYKPAEQMKILERKEGPFRNNLFSCIHKCGEHFPKTVWASTIFECDGEFKLEYLKDRYQSGCKSAIEKHYRTISSSQCIMYYSSLILMAGIYILLANTVISVFVTFLVIMPLIHIPR